jgi:N-acetylglutamate synthase-like GNAT family acetyltransferase
VSDHRIRSYAATDRPPCLAIFDSNTPTFFDRKEHADFETFLDKQTVRYSVVADSRGVVACGGWGWRDEEPRVALLCWGMVHRDLHRSGIGTALLRYRLAEIAKGDFDDVEIITSQHSSSFFIHAGFDEVDVKPNLFAPNLHGHRMKLAIAR